MSALPAFGDLSVIPQEHSAIFEETIRPQHEETTTVEDSQLSQSQSLLRDIELEHETTTVEESQSQSLLRDMELESESEKTTTVEESQETQSQSLLRDMEHELDDAEEMPMEAESSPASDLDNEQQAEAELNNAQDLSEAVGLQDAEVDDSELMGIDVHEGDDNTEDNSEETEYVVDVEKDNEDDGNASEKIFHLPLSKIKRIMKTDEDINLISKEALVAVAICTEHFVSMIAQQSYKLAAAGKKKTVGIQHVKATLSSSSVFDFLEGAIPQHEI